MSSALALLRELRSRKGPACSNPFLEEKPCVLEPATNTASACTPLPTKGTAGTYETELAGQGDKPRIVGPWRVVIDRNTPLRAPIRVNPWTSVIDPVRCIERTLADLEVAVVHRNAGRTTAFTLLIDEYVSRLAACGCRVRVAVLV